MKTYHRGHEIETIDDIWIYSDNKKPVSEDKNRLCGHCDQPSTIEGHDACIGTLIGVMNACCGHGNTDQAYVQFLDCHAVHGERAIEIIEELKK